MIAPIPQPRQIARGCLAGSGLLAVSSLAVMCVLAAAAQFRPVYTRLPFGYRVGLCVTLSDVGRLHVTWNRQALLTDVRFPIARSRSACGVLPWLPALPISGAMILPP